MKLPIALAMVAVLAARLVAVESNLAIVTARDSIQTADLRQHVETLADDSFEGREAGKQGGRAGTAYLRKELMSTGVKGAGDNGTYFQAFGAGYRNVLAVVPGNDPTLASEFILVTAHCDHVGYGNRKNSQGPVGYIHNGADDNASGVAALLEVTEALQKYSSGLSRSILVVFWDAEEKGLLGSKHWLENPTIDLDKVQLMVNVDMVGRLKDKLGLFGTRTVDGLRTAWGRANVGGDLKLDFPWGVVNNSDHYPFFQRGIPITMVHTGLHKDYHRPSDDVHLLDYNGIKLTTELVFNFVVAMANQSEIGEFRRESWSDTTEGQRYFERLHRDEGRRLGITWVPQDGSPGILVRGVSSNSLAQQAGVRPGDVITHVNGKVIVPATLQRVVDATYGSLELTVQRNSAVLSTKIELVGKRPRIGFAWRSDKAESNVVMLSYVVPESAAERAGLKQLDRIHTVNGQSIQSSAQFRELMSRAEGVVELLLERDGRMMQLELSLPAVP